MTSFLDQLNPVSALARLRRRRWPLPAGRRDRGFFHSGLQQLRAVNEAIAVEIDLSEVGEDVALGLFSTDASVLVGVQLLEQEIDAIVGNVFASSLEFVPVNFPIFVAVESAQDFVGALHLALALPIGVAHLDEHVDQVGGAATRA